MQGLFGFWSDAQGCAEFGYECWDWLELVVVTPHPKGFGSHPANTDMSKAPYHPPQNDTARLQDLTLTKSLNILDV